MIRPGIRNQLLNFVLGLLLVPSAAAAAERWTIGLTTNGVPIDALIVAGASTDSPTVLLIGGVSGKDQSSDAVVREVAVFEKQPQNRRRFRLLAIPLANPEAQALQFPPSGAAYREHVESHVLWRWIGTHAPDLALIAGADSGLTVALSENLVADVGRIPARRIELGSKILDSLPSPISR